MKNSLPIDACLTVGFVEFDDEHHITGVELRNMHFSTV